MSVSYEKEKKNLPSGYGKQHISHRPYHRGYVGHIYYGDRLEGEVENYLLRIDEHPFTPSVVKREKSSFLDRFPTEYPHRRCRRFPGELPQCPQCRRTPGLRDLL